MKTAPLLRAAASFSSALVIGAAFILGVPAAAARADEGGGPPGPVLDPKWALAFEWRSIGPANMGGRIIDLAVSEKDPTTFWVATASGGLLKTVNNGVTFEHQFDREATVSIGAVAVAASDPSIVWVGTGESNPRNSVSWGDGVYKSADGGKTWKNMGLGKSYQTGQLVIHPTDPNTVYVGAMGRCWGPSEDRGLYKTTDGGETWSKVLSIDDKTGVIDVVMHPSNPDTLLVATWERQRDGFDGNDPEKKWGPGSGLHKTTDGGATFRRITAGLPTSPLGRIGLDYSRANPDVVYAIVDCEKIGSANPNEAYLGITGENAEVGARLTRIVDDGPAAKAGLKTGDIVVNVNGSAVVTYQALLTEIRKLKPDDKIRVQASRDRELVEVEVALGKRPEQEGKPYGAYLGGQRANIQQEQGPEGHEYGGVYRSEDGGETWTRVNSLNPRPMYFSAIRVDPSDDKTIWIAGVSLHISRDGGKTFTDDAGRGTHADHHAMWIDPGNSRHVLLGNDGGFYMTWDQGKTWDHLNHVAIGQFYHVALDTRHAFNVYGGLQDNGSWGGPARQRAGAGSVNVDWFRVGGGDGFICAVDPEDPNQIYFSSQNGSTGWRNLATGRQGAIRPPRETGPDGQPIRYRFNWETPYILSAHNSRMYYSAGNHVFRSYKGGQELRKISPEITRTDKGSATALAESPLDPGVLYVGTDDGALWGTRDGGHTWTNLFEPTPESESESPPEPPTIAKAPVNGTSTAAPASESPAEQPRRARRGQLGAQFMEMLAGADKNGDGLIQPDEMPERAAFLFDRIDTDKSGTLDKAEIEAFRARQGSRARPQQGEGEEPAPPAGEQPAAAPPLEPHNQPVKPGTPSSAPPPAPAEKPTAVPPETAASPPATPAPPQPAQVTPASEDPISGLWKARLIGDLPPEMAAFEITLRLADGGKVSGDVRSDAYSGPIPGGTFDAATGELRFSFTGERGQASFTAKVDGPRMTGRVSLGGGDFALDFEAVRASAPAPAPKPAEPAGPGPSAAAGEKPKAAPGKPLRDLVPGPRWVASLQASRYEPGRVYLALDGHRSDDDAPYLFVSEDYGATWRSSVNNLPAETTRVLREDITSPEILYCGTEFGCYVTLNRGKDWTRLNGNLPTVAVHDFAQHPATGEIVAATHGRSLWVLDATALRQMTADTLAASAHFYKPAEARVWRSMPSRGVSGARNFVGQNPPSSAALFYSLASEAKEVSLKVTTLDGQAVRTLTPEGKTAGLHRVSWDLRRDPPPRGQGGPGGRGGPGATGFQTGQTAREGGPTQSESAPGGAGAPARPPEGAPPRATRPGSESEGEPAAPEPGSSQPGRAREGVLPQGAPAAGQAPPGGAAPQGQAGGGPGGGGGGGFGGGRFGGAPRVAPGTYILVLTVDGKELKQQITVGPDPDYPDAIAAEEEEELEEEGEEEPGPVIR